MCPARVIETRRPLRAVDARACESARRDGVRRRPRPRARRRRRAAGARGQHRARRPASPTRSAARDVPRRAPAARRPPRRRAIRGGAFELLGAALRGRGARRRRRPDRRAALRRAREQRLVRAREIAPAARASRSCRPPTWCVRGGRLHAWLGERPHAPVDVVYRRTDEDRLRDRRRPRHLARRRSCWRPLRARHAGRGQRVRRRRRRRQARARLRRGDGPLLPGRGAAAAVGARRYDLGRSPRCAPSALDAARRAGGEAAQRLRRRGRRGLPPRAAPRSASAGGASRASAPTRFIAQETRDPVHPSHRVRRPARAPPRRPAAVRVRRRRVSTRARRPHPGRVRRGRAGREQLAERRRQGHVGARR